MGSRTRDCLGVEPDEFPPTAAAHIATHAALAREYQGRRGVDNRFIETIIARTPGGFEHHGEDNHHAPDFRPVHEAYAELSDYADLMFVHGVERVELGIAPGLPTAEARKAYAECEYHAARLANAHTRLLLELGGFEDAD